MSSQPAVIKRLIKDFTSRRPMRTTSLIITIIGDVVSQHGSEVWLGSLVKMMALLGVNERLVRTSVFRLVKEGWLESERVGRRSLYRFSDYGSHEYERAARRIYALESSEWQGQWSLLIPQDIPEKHREKFRRSLLWQGYRAIAPGTFAKPGSGRRTLVETLEEFDLFDKVIILDAAMSSLSSERSMRKLVHERWQLADVAREYREFLANFKPLARWVGRGRDIDPETAFIARTLLIHDYRRVLLHDTPLPAELLPRAWPGAQALALTGSVYRQLAQSSAEYIVAQPGADDEPMPPENEDFGLRFDRVDPP